MPAARARRFVLVALAVSLAAFVTFSSWMTLTSEGAPAIAGWVFMALIFGGILAAQVLTLDVFRGDPRAFVKAAAAQPVWPFLVFLLGVSADHGLRAALGRSFVGGAIWTALLFGAGLGLVGVLALAVRAGLGGRGPAVVV